MQVMTNFIQNLLYESDKPLVDLYQRLRMHPFFVSFVYHHYLNRLLLSSITFTNSVRTSKPQSRVELLVSTNLVFFVKAHRIGNQSGKQRELIISKYTPCKSFSVEYWKDYSTNTLNNNIQSRKQVGNGKAIGTQRHFSGNPKD